MKHENNTAIIQKLQNLPLKICAYNMITRMAVYSKHSRIEDNYVDSLERNLSSVIHENENLIKKCDEMRLLTPEQEDSPTFVKENMVHLEKSFEIAINATINQIEEFKDAIHTKNNEFLLYKEEKEREIANLNTQLSVVLTDNMQYCEKLVMMNDLENKLKCVIDKNSIFSAKLATMQELEEKLQCQSDNLAKLLLKMTFLEREKNSLQENLTLLQRSFVSFIQGMFEKFHLFSQRKVLSRNLISFTDNAFQSIKSKLLRMEQMLATLNEAQL